MSFNVDFALKLMANSYIALDKLIIHLHFSKLGVHMEKNFLVSVASTVDSVIKLQKQSSRGVL